MGFELLKKPILLSAAFCIILLGFAACVSMEAGSGKPEWLGSYPKDSRFFIGIGSSNTGKQAEDMELARAKAMAALAAAISVTIQSEQTFTAVDNSEGGSFDSAEMIIREAVDQNLEAVEIHDSYYSEKEGYWFYVRLDKMKWAEIQRREMEKVIRRTLSVIEPKLTDSGASTLQKLTALGAGWEIVVQSPYAELLEIEKDGRRVTLIDYIENKTGSILEELSIVSGIDNAALKTGSAEPLEISVVSADGTSTGKLPLLFIQKQPEEKVIEGFTTEADGNYSGELKTSALNLGKNILSIVLDMDTLGIKAASFKNRIIIPSADIRIDVEKLKALLVTRVAADAGIPGLFESVKALLSLHLPFDLISDQNTETEYTIDFALAIRDVPENDFGIFMSFCKATISILHEGTNIYSYETEEFKDGGLDYEQSHQRASKALFQYLKNDNTFAARLKEAL